MTLEEMLPEGSMVIGHASSIKYLSDEGDVHLMHTMDGDLAPWEVIGMLISHCDDLRQALREGSE